jgi:flagellar biosynthesis protein FlhA
MRSPASLILLINIVGGLIIGIMQHHMPWARRCKTYTLLTVGDGIVTQVPALVIAVGTGIIVTRSASDGNLSQEALRQITSFPEDAAARGRGDGGPADAARHSGGPTAYPALPHGAGCLDGLPHRRFESAQAPGEAGTDGRPAGGGWRRGRRQGRPLRRTWRLSPSRCRWAALGPASDREGQPFMERIAAFRKQHAQEFGPGAAAHPLQGRTAARPGRYEIHIDGALSGRGEVRADRLLAIHPRVTCGDSRQVDPRSDLRAAGTLDRAPNVRPPPAPASRWSMPSGVPDAPDRGAAARILHLADPCRNRPLLARVRQNQPALVEELVPQSFRSATCRKCCRTCCAKRCRSGTWRRSWKPWPTPAGKQGNRLPDRGVRHRAGLGDLPGPAGEANALHVLTLDPAIESRFIQGVQNSAPQASAGQAGQFVLEPQMLEKFIGTGCSRPRR